MWKPPERVKHPLLEARWPTASEARGSLLFSPLEIGSKVLDQRTWIPAMVPWRASDDGFVTDEILAWYRRFAKGRPGVIVVEATGIRDIPSGPLLRIGHDRFIPGLSDLVETVRQASGGRTRLFIQIIDFLAIRRRPDPRKYLQRYLDITDRHRQALGGSYSDREIRQHLTTLSDNELEAILDQRELEALRFGYRERITDTHLPHILDLPKELPTIFSAAAGRARAAGFDGVELHFAHAYTMASFLSARNDRNDGYGVSRENRIRLPLQVYREVRDRVGGDFIVGCRYLSDECIKGGSDVDDAIYFGIEFARAGMDFLSLSRGGKFEDAKQPKIGWAAYPYTGPSGYECMPTAISDHLGPFGRNVPHVSRIRHAIRAAGFETPIIVAGGVSTFEQAEEILQSGGADAVAAARQSLADPDWFLKMQQGRGEEIRRCVYSNYCEGLDQKHKQVTCQLWDRLNLEQAGVQLTTDGKRRLTAPE
jgi:2,4-dienoyl-CoA reductase-like NADH-dependent reductase (Old Yellow Enzyme family)